MIEHLRGLPIRQQIGDVGFDAYCSLVVECDNQSDCTLWTAPPAPQSGDKDHYDTFIDRIARFYTTKLELNNLSRPVGTGGKCPRGEG